MSELTKTLTYLLILAVMASTAAAADIAMKSNSVYTAQFRLTNIEDDTLVNCLPYFSQDLKGQPWVIIKPQQFDLASKASQDIVLLFQQPPAGYYQDSLQIRCERYLGNTFIGTATVINPATAPQYSLTVSLAGAGEAYRFSPTNKFIFLGVPGKQEKASFQIINIGTVDLPVSFQIPPPFVNEVSIDPSRISIPAGGSQAFTVTINVPQDFTSLDTNITASIGDYGDAFIIQGSLQSAEPSPVQSIGFGNIQVGTLQIPAWLIALIIIAAVYVIYTESRKKRRSRK